jgi:hypothetical protein
MCVLKFDSWSENAGERNRRRRRKRGENKVAHMFITRQQTIWQNPDRGELLKSYLLRNFYFLPEGFRRLCICELKMNVFWVVAPCSLVKVYWRTF